MMSNPCCASTCSMRSDSAAAVSAASGSSHDHVAPAAAPTMISGHSDLRFCAAACTGFIFGRFGMASIGPQQPPPINRDSIVCLTKREQALSQVNELQYELVSNRLQPAQPHLCQTRIESYFASAVRMRVNLNVTSKCALFEAPLPHREFSSGSGLTTCTSNRPAFLRRFSPSVTCNSVGVTIR